MRAASLPEHFSQEHRRPLLERFVATRRQTTALTDSLDAEDAMLQSAPFTSPVKWHLAHTTWFFDQFVLATQPGYRPFDSSFGQLFNSYYESLGKPYTRSQRGLLSRPSLATIHAYRRQIDEQVCRLLDGPVAADHSYLVELGINHEQQHQELILTDIKHAFHLNPLHPAVVAAGIRADAPRAPPLRWIRFEGGMREIGATAGSFAFDNERPRHAVLCTAFELASRVITNGEYEEFLIDGGYQRPDLWLADGWDWVQEQRVNRPLYWSPDRTFEFTLAGPRDIDRNCPVCHVSYFEAYAFAKWSGARLPAEREWEIAAAAQPVTGNLLESGNFHPGTTRGSDATPAQMFGDVWEWTGCAHVPYPGYQPPSGALAEYNQKFMCSQIICRGGSCVTPAELIRPSYRNFFYPQQRWQFLGIRLARDATGTQQ